MSLIVFETQDAFEDAVMATLTKRLAVEVDVSSYREYYSEDTRTSVEVSLKDTGHTGYNTFATGKDY